MKKTMLATAIAMVLGLMAQGVYANVLYVYGIVTSVTSVTPLVKAGDAVYLKVNYTQATGVVTRTTVTVNDSALNLARASDGSGVTIDENPADGTVQWSYSNSPNVTIDVASNTPGGVIPCIDSFDLGKTFQVFFNGITFSGTVTAKPQTRTGN